MENIIIGILLLLVAVIIIALAKGKKSKPSKKAFYEKQSKYVACGGGYFARSLLNKSESEAYRAILDYIYANPAIKGRVRVFGQVCIGEFLGNKDWKLFNAINTKRVDFLITDMNYCPLVVLEMNGSGHRLGSTAELRDAIKQKAIENAGIAFYPIEVARVREAYEATLRIMAQHEWV